MKPVSSQSKPIHHNFNHNHNHNRNLRSTTEPDTEYNNSNIHILMKFSLIAAVAASAAIVSAIPIRIEVVPGSIQRTESRHDPFAHLRFGFPTANSNVAHLIANGQAPVPKHRVPCGGRSSRFKQTAIEISNSVRKMFGFPLIDDHKSNNGAVHILPFIGSPVSVGQGWVKPKGGDWNYVVNLSHTRPGRPGDHGELPPPPRASPAHHRHHHHKHHGHHKFGPHGDFGMRIHAAIMSLGPWEGRAVAFVLGCGIGVLLRMFWVLTVLAYRSIRGGSSEQEYTHIDTFEQDDDDEPRRAVRTPFSAPPIYVYPVDEKVALEVITPIEVAPVAQQPEESK